MTAIVGILNKKGVAIAADSASTTKKKIINLATKCFVYQMSYQLLSWWLITRH